MHMCGLGMSLGIHMCSLGMSLGIYMCNKYFQIEQIILTKTLYLGGCLGVESLAVREQAAFVARVAGSR